MSILSLKRWERVAYPLAEGVEIPMKLKRLKRHEAKPLARVLVAVFEQFEKAKAEDLTPSQKAAILNQVYEVIPEDKLKDWFGSCVKDVDGLEIDGEAVTSGADLLDNADDDLLFWLLFKLHSLSKLTGAESNASASRSGSLRLVTGAAGSSPATTTDGEAGREPSIVTGIPDSTGSSTGE